MQLLVKFDSVSALKNYSLKWCLSVRAKNIENIIKNNILKIELNLLSLKK